MASGTAPGAKPALKLGFEEVAGFWQGNSLCIVLVNAHRNQNLEPQSSLPRAFQVTVLFATSVRFEPADGVMFADRVYSESFFPQKKLVCSLLLSSS